MGDLIHPTFKERFNEILERKKVEMSGAFPLDTIDLEKEAKRYIEWKEQLLPFIASIEHSLERVLSLGDPVLFEGAQGVLLDTVFGTYPYVTSSHTLSSGILAGVGIGPKHVNSIIGVLKAYASRVGNGPFPTEEADIFGSAQEIREIGTTTGRKRRVGWFDAVLSKHAVKLTGTTSVALMKLDVLSKCSSIKICVGYSLDGTVTDIPPVSPYDLDRVSPIYEEMPGWEEDITHVRRLGDLPKNARSYIEKIEELVEAPIGLVSVGPERSQTIVVNQEI